MALEPTTPDPLRRALEAAKSAQPHDDWVNVSTSTLDRVRSLGRGPAEPIVVRDAAGDDAHDQHGSRTFVSTRVVVAALRRLLLDRPSHAPVDVRLRLDGVELVGVEVDLVAAYGLDLVELGDVVRRQVLQLVLDHLGPGGPLGAEHVHVAFVDVVVGDARVT